MTETKRIFVKGKAIATYPCNGIFVTEIRDKYDRKVKEEVSFTEHNANQTHSKWIERVKQGVI